MATQLAHPSFRPLPAPQPAPNIRVAYIAGEATAAIARAIEPLPETVREATLEQIEIAGLAEAVIASAKGNLSPAMYTAFLRWGETASRFTTDYAGDENGEAHCNATSAAISALAVTPAKNLQDVLLKAHILGLEHGDCPSFGPFTGARGEFGDGSNCGILEAVNRDLPEYSPVLSMLNKLAEKAWVYSPNDIRAFSREIGGAITSAFSYARGADSAGPSIEATPATAWSQARRAFEQADAAFEACPMELEEPFDALGDSRYDAMVDLFTTPAPTVAELAYKLALYNKTNGRHLDVADEIGEALEADGHRLAGIVPTATQAWADARAAFEIADEAARDTSSNPDDLVFNQAFVAQHEALKALLATPALTPADLAFKISLYAEHDADELEDSGGGLIAAIAADARRLAGLPLKAPSLTPDANWVQALGAFETASAAAKASGLTDEQVDERASVEQEAADVVMELPARTIEDAATKLRIQITLHPLVEREDLTEILADLDRLGRETVELRPENPAVVAAFATFRDAFGELKAAPADIDQATEDAFYKRMDPADVVLKTAPAFTPVGISMKLKRAFVGIVGEAWSDHAVFDDRPPAFAEEIARGGFYIQMFWRAIEDLDRMAGSVGAEQAA